MADVDATTDEKEGRVLSAKNAKRLKEAMSTVKDVLSGAGIDLEEATKEALDVVASKCGTIAEYAPPEAYNGAHSFDDYDDIRQENKRRYDVEDQIALFQGLATNVLRDPESTMTTKVKELRALVDTLPDRVENPPEYKEDDGPGLLDRVSDFLRGTKEIKKVKGKFVVTSKDGKRNLGSYDTEDEAKKRLGQVEMFKRKALEDDDESTMVLWTKDLDGRTRWVAYFSNNFEDREGETFSAEAHKEYVDWVYDSKEFPGLWLWHTPGTQFGQADFLDYTDHIMVASGVIDAGKERVVDALKGAGPIAVSHGYRYRVGDKADDGTYHRYRTFEITVLPAARASNPWTQFDVLDSVDATKEDAMTLRPDRKKWLTKVLGEEDANEVEAFASRMSAKALGKGVAYKEVVEAMAEEGPDAVADVAKPAGDVKPADEKPDAAGDSPDEEGEEADDAEKANAGDAAANPVVEAIKEMKDTLVSEITSTKEAVAELRTFAEETDERFKEVASAIDALQGTDDEKLSTRLRARGGGTNGERPTDEGVNGIKAEEAYKENAGRPGEERGEKGRKSPAAAAVAPFMEQITGAAGGRKDDDPDEE